MNFYNNKNKFSKYVEVVFDKAKSSDQVLVDVSNGNKESFDSEFVSKIKELKNKYQGYSLLINLETLPKSVKKTYIQCICLDDLGLDNVYFSESRYDGKYKEEPNNQGSVIPETSNQMFHKGTEVEFNRFISGMPEERSFYEAFISMADRKHIDDFVQVYKNSGVSRSRYSRLISGVTKKISKETLAAFAIGLKLDLKEANEFFSEFGYIIGVYSMFDKILRFYISKRIYDIDELDTCLLYFHMNPLGEQVRE